MELLALVPVTTLFFSVFTAFSAFQDLRGSIEGFISEHLFANAELGKQILFHLDRFAGNAKAVREGHNLVLDALCASKQRDAILAADQALTTGANRCALWRAFARRGLGSSADQGSANSNTDNVAAFDLPLDCSLIFADGFETGDTGGWSAAVP